MCWHTHIHVASPLLHYTLFVLYDFSCHLLLASEFHGITLCCSIAKQQAAKHLCLPMPLQLCELPVCGC